MNSDTVTKIGFIEAVCFVLIAMINKVISNAPKIMLFQAKTATWLNIIYIAILLFIFVVIISKLTKNFLGKDIIDISSFLGKKPLKIIMSILFIVLLLFITSMNLRVFISVLKLVYFETAPVLFLAFIFLLGAYALNIFGLKAIVKTNLLVIPLILFTVIVIVISASPYFVFERLTPVLGDGVNATFFSGLTNLFAFSGMKYLYLLPPFLEKKEQFKKIGLTAVVISSTFIFLSVVSLLLSFSFIIESEELIPLYILTRIIEYGRFFQRTDAIFIFIWILATFSYISINTFLVSHIFKKVTNIKNPKAIIGIILILILGLLLFPANSNNVQNLEDNILRYYVIIVLYIISPIVLILANIKHWKISKKTQDKLGDTS